MSTNLASFWEWFAHSPVPVQTAWISGIFSVTTIGITQFFSKKNTDKALAAQREQFIDARQADEKKYQIELGEKKKDRFNEEKLGIFKELLTELNRATNNLRFLFPEQEFDVGAVHTAKILFPLYFSSEVNEHMEKVESLYWEIYQMFFDKNANGKEIQFFSYETAREGLEAEIVRLTDAVKRDLGIS